jgi:hypothetical protein
MEFLRGWAGRVFALDLRSLALLRVGLGLVCLLTLAERAGDFVFFFSDTGCLPRSWLFREHFPAAAFSVYSVTGNLWLLGLMYAFHAASAVAVTLGWHTRAATVALWLMTASLHTRNPLLLDGGDEVARVILFWALFLPWGQVWSLDARRPSGVKGGGERPPATVSNPWTAAFVLQLAQVYFWAGVMKVGVEWSDGSAGQLFLTLEHMLYPWSARLLDYPEALAWLSRFVRDAEVCLPLLLLLPLATPIWRLLLVVVFSGFHLSLLAIGTFPRLSLTFLVVTLALLPSQVWDGWRSPAPRWRATLASGVVTSLLLLLVTAWNVYQSAYIVELPRRFVLPAVPKAVVTACGLNQFWAFFSPYPSRIHGWVVAEARLSDGRVIDLMTGGSPLWSKPVPLHRHYKNHSWRMLCRAAVTMPGFEAPLLQGLITRWESANPGEVRVVEADLYDVQIRTALDFSQSPPSARWLERWPARPGDEAYQKMR